MEHVICLFSLDQEFEDNDENCIEHVYTSEYIILIFSGLGLTVILTFYIFKLIQQTQNKLCINYIAE